MGKGKALKSIVSLSILSFFLFGFTGMERYVELEGFLNGRSEAAFRAQDRNVRALLTKGTRGEILERKKMASGNYAFRVKTLNGSHSGQDFWVYYKISNPALKVYEKPPASWGVDTKQTPVAETVRDVGVYRDPSTVGAGDNIMIPGSAPKDNKLKDSTGVDGTVRDATSDRLAVDQVNRATELVRSAGTEPGKDPEFCYDCITNIPTPTFRPDIEPSPADQMLYAISDLDEVRTPIRKATRYMGDRCYNIIKQNGKYGKWGRQLLSIMTEPKYIDAYTKNNSLGAFCPNFNSLSEPQRLQAWAWFWQSLATEESKPCDLNQYHDTHYIDKKGVRRRLNPREGWGIFTAELDREYRLDKRGIACENIKTFAGQARCAVDTMYQKQLSRGKTASRSDYKYWGPTRDKDMAVKMMPHMRRFTACF